MKNILLTLFLLLPVIVKSQGIRVQSSRCNSTDFSAYQTYYWARQVDNQLDENGYFSNDVILKSDIRDIVHEQLSSRGFQLDSSLPDLLVNFRIFDHAAQLNSAELNGGAYWGKDERCCPNNLNKVSVEVGTLILSIVDRRNRRLVWEGSASALVDVDGFIKKESKIREAVNLLMEDFVYPGSEYTRR